MQMMKVLVSAMLLSAACAADTYVYTGAAGDGKWSTAGNWEGGTFPASSSASIVVLSNTIDNVEIVNDKGDFTLRLLKIAAGSKALRLSGGKFTLGLYNGDNTVGDLPEESCAFYCAAAGVSVEIASDIALGGLRQFRQVTKSDVTFSGRFADASATGTTGGCFNKHIVGSSSGGTTRFTLSGTCTMRGDGEGTTVTLRGGVNVIASPQAIGDGKRVNLYHPGGNYELKGGTYGTLGLGGTILAVSFTGDTKVANTVASGSNGTYTFKLDGATKVEFEKNLNTPAGGASVTLQGVGPGLFRVGGTMSVKNVTSVPSLAVSVGTAISVESGNTASIPLLLVGGDQIVPGRYQSSSGTDATAEKVFWMTGAGVVSVAGGSTMWKTAADGNWSDAASWTLGQPGAGTAAWLVATGGSYTVTAPAAGCAATNIVIGNAGTDTATLAVNAPMAFENAVLLLGTGGKLQVGAGGSLRHAFSGASGSWTSADAESDKVSVRAGATLEVSGGEAVFTNFVGKMRVAGTAEAPGRIRVSGGRLAFHAAKTVHSRIVLDEGGELNVTDGKMMLAQSPEAGVVEHYPPLQMSGGSLKVSGGGVLELGPLKSHLFGSGTARFEGNACLTNGSPSGKNIEVYAGPTANSQTSRVEFAGAARFWTTFYATCRNFQLGYDYADLRQPSLPAITDGLAVLDYASTATTRFGAKFSIGSDYCRGEAHIRSGQVQTWYRGIDVGGFTEMSSTSRSDAHGDGLLVVDGGKVYVETLDVNAAGQKYPTINRDARSQLDGLIVGAGWRTVPGSASRYRGRIEIRSGEIQNAANASLVVVGAGQADGEIVQTGGKFTNEADWPTVLGFEGGSGLYALTNGTATFTDSVYAGGIATNTILRNLANCPHRHDATGRLVLAGGTMTVGKDVVLAADGSGTLEVGPAGSLVAQNMVLSNGTGQASLAFTLGANGAGSVTLTGSLVVRAGARLTVDLGGCTGSKVRYPLLSCGQMEGRFSADDIEFSGDRNLVKVAQLEQTAKGLNVLLVRGTLLLFR